MKKWQTHISINPEIRFGKPCIKGTRIAIDDILNWLSNDMSYDEIIADFPSLTREDVLASLAFVAHKGENTRILLTVA